MHTPKYRIASLYPHEVLCPLMQFFQELLNFYPCACVLFSRVIALLENWCLLDVSALNVTILLFYYGLKRNLPFLNTRCAACPAPPASAPCIGAARLAIGRRHRGAAAGARADRAGTSIRWRMA